MPNQPRNFQAWPDDAVDLDQRSLARLYGLGFMGAYPNPADTERIRSDPDGDFAHAAHTYGLAGSGAGKLSLPFLSVLQFSREKYSVAQKTGDCLDPEVWVLGETIKQIKDVRVGDRVWTGEGRLTEVISTRRLLTHKPSVRIHGRGMLPLMCTADHELLVYRLPVSDRRRATPANAARVADGRERGTAGKGLAAAFVSRAPEWVKAGDLREGDVLLSPACYEQLRRPESPGCLADSDDGRWLLGYFAGNGHASRKAEEGAVEWSFPLSKPQLVGKALSILESHGFSAKESRSHGHPRIRIHGANTVEWFRTQFYEGREKSFPGWAIGDASFLAGLIDADGCQSHKAHLFHSTSLSLVNGAYASLCHLGYTPLVSEAVRGRGVYANAKPLFCVRWNVDSRSSVAWRDERFVARPVKNVEFLEGPREVCDIGVASEHHSFLAGGLAVHNCVSHSTRNALDLSRAVEIHIKGESEEWIEDAATETIYWGRGHNGQGASCSTLAKFVQSRGGILLRLQYPDLGLDLRSYNWRTGAGGNSGPPESVLAEMRKHQVQTVAYIDPRSDPIAQARDALANGYGVSCCSGYGFSSTRNEDGIASRRGSWAHAMAWTACDDRPETVQKHGGPLFLIQNSWGYGWISGPKVHGQPDGSFWVKSADALGILKSSGSFVLSNIRGFPARKLPDYGFQSGGLR